MSTYVVSERSVCIVFNVVSAFGSRVVCTCRFLIVFVCCWAHVLLLIKMSAAIYLLLGRCLYVCGEGDVCMSVVREMSVCLWLGCVFLWLGRCTVADQVAGCRGMPRSHREGGLGSFPTEQ